MDKLILQARYFVPLFGKVDKIRLLVRGKIPPKTPEKKTAEAVRMKGDFMTKAEKNYRRDYGHKSNEELALNYSRDSLKEELYNMLETVNPDDLSESEKAYLNGRKQRKNHTLNIRFNDTEWEQIYRLAELLKMKNPAMSESVPK